MFKLSAIACFIVLSGAAMAGCGIFNPSKDDGGGIEPLPVYKERSTPQNVLGNLALAYDHEDSMETKVLYDSSYVGTSVDLTGSTADLEFRYVDEVKHVAALAANPLVTVQDMYFSGALTRLPSDNLSHPEWTVIQISGSSFRISVFEQSSGNTYEATGSTETFEFTFQPTPDSSSPTDTLWKIIRWKETKSP